MVKGEVVLRKEEDMVKKLKKLARKIWDILNGQDRNFDGKVDIHDKMIEAEEKASANKKS
tara:strand:- start:53 stop:232 length:180 start_codon:yes stop_codon:yes gene_type:complete